MYIGIERFFCGNNPVLKYLYEKVEIFSHGNKKS